MLVGLTAAAMAGCAGREPASAPPAIAAPAPEPPLPVSVPRDATREFRAVADVLVAALREHRIPGAALGIMAGGRERHASFGVASLSSLRPVTADTLFQIGSLTKTYTATAIWRLIEDGKLALDAPVRRYMRGLRLRDEATITAVTVANLLEQTAGWYGDDGFDTGEDAFALTRYVDTRLPELPQLFECGEFFSDNDAAFQLLGRLIELTALVDYNDAMQRLVLGPLRLSDTVLDRAAVLKRRYADGHVAMPINGRDTVAVQTPLWAPRSSDPATGMWSTTADVLRYARLHLGLEPPGRTRILRAASLRAMQEPAVGVPGLPISMGRSWFSQDVDGLRVISHGGDTLGQHTVFLAVPQRGFAFVLMLNGRPGAEAGLAVLDEALARYPGFASLSGKVGPTRALLVPPETPLEGPGERLRVYAGRYADPGMTETLRIDGPGLERTLEPTPEPGSWRPALVAPAPEPAPVTFLERDIGVIGGMRLPFVRDRDGRVGWVADRLRLRPRA